MEVLRCLQCKGEIALEENSLIGRCLACGSIYYFKGEKNSKIISLLNQANISRLRGDYDGAILAYQIALKEDETDADAYWGILLSKFGIEYIEDARTGKFIPTCRRTISHSILNDENYLNAIKYASPEQAKEYERQAQEIEQLQQSIKEKIKNEQDYDVFLCFKSNDENGNPTPDRFIARNIYNELEKRGIRTFFSEISLKDRLGQDYEPIIYKALYTCRVFILIATNEDYIQSSWVKNEWARFRDRAADEGIENYAFAVFKDIKINQLPPIFRTQGIDLAKYPAGGYEIEIADNLELKLKQKKFTSLDESFGNPNFMLEDKVVDLLEKKLVSTRQTYEERLDRALACDEMGNRQKALAILEELTDEYPRKAWGWFYRAKLITNNFKIDPVDFHLNATLKKDYNFYMSNAIRFASDQDGKKMQNQTKHFEGKLQQLQKFDTQAEQFEQCLEQYHVLSQKIANHEIEYQQSLKKSKSDLVELLEQNNKQLREIKKRVGRKNYYIRNISLPPNFAFSIFNFLGFVVIISALIGSMINLKRALDGNGTVGRVVFEFIILLIVGIMPFIIVEILRTQAKLKKVKKVIVADKEKFNRLKLENASIKLKIDEFDKLEENKKTQIENNLEQAKQQFEKAKSQIVQIYQNAQNAMKQHDFMIKYIERYDQFTKAELEQRIKDNKLQIKTLQEELKNIVDANQKYKRDLAEKKPKYFLESYENFAQKISLLIEKNVQRTQNIEQTIKQLQTQNSVFELQRQKTFLTQNIFENFIDDYENYISKQSEPEQQKLLQIKDQNVDLAELHRQRELKNQKQSAKQENKTFKSPRPAPIIVYTKPKKKKKKK